jgi:uncharacterized secreted protein with C-terminal beta-propeller domain
MIHKDRTLVPLRFISEFFSAEVSYEAATQTGVVKVKGKTAQFPVGQSYYLLDGKKVSLDTETLNVSGRIFLPLRAISEEVMGLKVAYENKVIAIGEQATLDKDQIQIVKDRIGTYVKVSSLTELRSYLAQSRENYRYLTSKSAQGEAVPAPTESPSLGGTASESESANQDSAGVGDHSTTNTQVAGVDEADIIKTDGRYIYMLSGEVIHIVKAGGTMEVAARVTLEEGYYPQEMYVDGDRLVIIGSRHSGDAYPAAREEEPVSNIARILPYFGKSLTFAKVYDISDMSSVELLRSFEVEGSLTTSRKQGDYLYLLSNLTIWNWGDGEIRPLMGENGKLAPMPVDDIMVMPGRPAEAYLTLTALNVLDASEVASSETIAGSGYTAYMSNSAMYIALNSWNYDADAKLDIARFTIQDGSIGYTGSGQVKGWLNDQFSMDVHEGYLRVATTFWNEKQSRNENNLYVLDDGMQVSGAILGFAPDERIYSARFMGDRGYVVTFRQVDPLFVFDLSDPQNPRITGELKVPGFSSYLHPVSESVILGVGSDVKDVYVRDKNGKEVVISQQTGGIKLSLFDVSDMGKPREIDSLVIGDRGYTELQYNHKAAMFKENQSLVAFPANLSSYDYKENWEGALVVSYGGNRLTELSRIAASQTEEGYYGGFGQRLVYIGDTLYYAQGHIIRSFDSHSFRETGSLALQ